MAEDAVGLLDALGLDRAHLVGRSMGGGIVALAALHHADRVASLTLVSTTSGGTNLPPMSADVAGYGSSGGPDPSDPGAVVEFIVGLMDVYSGGSPYFDEHATRALAERDLARTRNVESCLTNHFVIDTGGQEGTRLEEIHAPTLVVHGERDPVFPLEHGHALQKAIANAELLVMENTGHELPPPIWDVFVPALLRQTGGS